jgi:hypothetical protein
VVQVDIRPDFGWPNVVAPQGFPVASQEFILALGLDLSAEIVDMAQVRPSTHPSR